MRWLGKPKNGKRMWGRTRMFAPDVVFIHLGIPIDKSMIYLWYTSVAKVLRSRKDRPRTFATEVFTEMVLIAWSLIYSEIRHVRRFVGRADIPSKKGRLTEGLEVVLDFGRTVLAGEVFANGLLEAKDADGV